MKKFFVIGNPIKHSLSPEIHNYWIKQHNLKCQYEKIEASPDDLKNLINDLRNKKIHGLNITVPYKQMIIPYLDKLSPEAELTKSVNTVIFENEKLYGHNTDINGFELAIRHCKYDLENREILILGAGGVVPSIVYALKKSKVKKINIMNRTYENALKVKKIFNDINLVKWNDNCNYDMIINATSMGLKETDEIKINYISNGKKKFFFDVIYNPQKTNFLKEAEKNSHRIENGKMMFVYQAHQAFTLWHKMMPIIDKEVINIISK